MYGQNTPSLIGQSRAIKRPTSAIKALAKSDFPELDAQNNVLAIYRVEILSPASSMELDRSATQQAQLECSALHTDTNYIIRAHMNGGDRRSVNTDAPEVSDTSRYESMVGSRDDVKELLSTLAE